MSIYKCTALCLAVVAAGVLAPTLQAGLTELPDGYLDGWSGKSTYYQNFGGGQFVYGVIEFAVYDTQAVGYSGFTAPGDQRFLYAYQIFADSAATASFTYFALTGINPEALESVEYNMGTAESENGIDVSDMGMNLSRTKVYYEFENGLLIRDEKSVILLLGSSFLPTIGGYEISRAPDDEIPIPGDPDFGDPAQGGGVEIPEPATLVMLLGGAAMTLRKRK